VIVGALALAITMAPTAASAASDAGGGVWSAANRIAAHQPAPSSSRSGSVTAKTSSSTSDPAGDIAYCQADLLSATAGFTDGAISFSSTTSCAVDPTTDPAWRDGNANIGWAIDTTGDGSTDFVAIILNDGTDVVGGVVQYANSAAQSVTCTFTPGYSPKSFSATFAKSCIGGVDSFRFFGGSQWDENPSGSCTCPVDTAPDTVWSAAVTNSVTPPPPPAPAKRQGYWMIGKTGDTYAFGDAQNYGNSPMAADVVDLEPSPSGNGYWTVDSQGHVQAHGDAQAPAPAPALTSGERITAISGTKSGAGYWLFSNLGRVFSYGDAPFYGDMAGKTLNGPVLDSIPTASGLGYYMVASDGGIFTFGDATFLGSMGDVKLNAPVQSLVPDDDGSGYWLVASDGGIFAFDAPFYGSMGDVKLNTPVTGMVGFGKGYLMVGEDGGIFTFGEAPFFGSLGDNPPSQPIVSTAVLNK
jgi:hypothetical protein